MHCSIIAVELCQELDKTNLVSVTIDGPNSKEQGCWRAYIWCEHCPLTFHKRATWAEVPIYKSIVGYFMVCQDRLETYLLQLFAHPDTSEWFSIISVMNFEVNNVAEQKHALLVTIFFCILKFSFSSTLLLPPWPTAVRRPGKVGKFVRCGSLLCTWRRCESRTVARKSSIRGLDFQIWQKFHWFIVFRNSIWGGLDLCLGGISPPKPPWQRDCVKVKLSEFKSLQVKLLQYFVK